MVTIEQAHEIVAAWIATLGNPEITPINPSSPWWPGETDGTYWQVPYNMLCGGRIALVDRHTGELKLVPQGKQTGIDWSAFKPVEV